MSLATWAVPDGLEMFTDILASNLTGQNKPKWHLSPEDLKGWSQNRIRWNGMKCTVIEKEGGNTP
jgi:hypothetical protein